MNQFFSLIIAHTYTRKSIICLEVVPFVFFVQSTHYYILNNFLYVWGKKVFVQFSVSHWKLFFSVFLHFFFGKFRLIVFIRFSVCRERKSFSRCVYTKHTHTTKYSGTSELKHKIKFRILRKCCQVQCSSGWFFSVARFRRQQQEHNNLT